MAAQVKLKSWEQVLKRAIRLARQVERAVQASALPRPLQVVAYGSLVRNRRYAAAVAQMGRASAYEARPIVRSMIEIWGNYRWIRLRQANRRANRYVKYLALDHVKLVERMPPSMHGPTHQELVRLIKRQRASVRHLFRSRGKSGPRRAKLTWAKSWAKVPSFEARMREVAESRPPSERESDDSIYFFYSLFSGATHGSPLSFMECIEAFPGGLRVRRRPERRPLNPMAAAASCLCDTIGFVCVDLSIPLLGQVQMLDAQIRALGGLSAR